MDRFARKLLALALPLLALALLVAACAPAAGGSSGAAIRAGSEAIPVQRGQTVFVRVDSSLAAFGITEQDLRATTWVPTGVRSQVGDVTSQFGLRDVEGATGWQIDLSRMRVERSTVNNPVNATTSHVVDLWAELRVEVPADAIAGVYRVRAVLEMRGGGRQSVTFRLDVRG